MTITFPRDLPDIPIKASRFGLNVNQSIFASGISRKVQVQQHAGGVTDRWEGVITTARLSVAQQAELTAFLVSLRGVEGSILLGDPDRKSPRSGTAGNLLPADSRDEFSGTAGLFHTYWSGKTIASLGLKVGDVISGDMEVKSTAGIDRVVLTWAYLDAAGAQISQVTGTEVTSSSYQNSQISSVTIPAGTVFLFVNARNLDTSETAFARNASVNRGANAALVLALVMGASQSGRSLSVDGLPVDTNNLFLTGDYFELEGVIYMLLADVSSDGSGETTLDFEPALRTTPADNAQLLFENTVLTARLLTNVAAWETDHLRTGEISFAWEEVL